MEPFSAVEMARLEAIQEWNRPLWHTPIELGINQFKRELKLLPGLKKNTRNLLVKAYKKRAWMEWKGISKLRGTYPTHPYYGKSVKVELSGIKGAEHEVAVKINGNKK